MTKRAVFFDIDGTLWDRYSRIPESTVRAIKELKAGGNPVFICSGRTRGYITDPALLSLEPDGIVSGCGTMVEYKGAVRFYYRIDPKLAVLTVDTVRRYGFLPILEGKDALYLDKHEFADHPYGQKLFRELGERARPIDGGEGSWEFSKLSCVIEGLDTKACFEELSAHYSYIVHGQRIVEMVPKGFDKGRGLLRAMDIAGLSPEDSVAVGDSVNDLDMFASAGISVAMGSGSQEAKDAADIVTDGIYEDGIYNAMKRLGLI